MAVQSKFLAVGAFVPWGPRRCRRSGTLGPCRDHLRKPRSGDVRIRLTPDDTIERLTPMTRCKAIARSGLCVRTDPAPRTPGRTARIRRRRRRRELRRPGQHPLQSGGPRRRWLPRFLDHRDGWRTISSRRWRPGRQPGERSVAWNRPPCSWSGREAATAGTTTGGWTCASITPIARSRTGRPSRSPHAVFGHRIRRSPAVRRRIAGGDPTAPRLHRMARSWWSLADNLQDWLGWHNLEERWVGKERIDPVVLAELRKTSSAFSRGIRPPRSDYRTGCLRLGRPARTEPGGVGSCSAPFHLHELAVDDASKTHSWSSPAGFDTPTSSAGLEQMGAIPHAGPLTHRRLPAQIVGELVGSWKAEP